MLRVFVLCKIVVQLIKLIFTKMQCIPFRWYSLSQMVHISKDHQACYLDAVKKKKILKAISITLNTTHAMHGLKKKRGEREKTDHNFNYPN